MSATDGPQVTVKILERNYRIKCQPQEAVQLQRAASYVDQKMRALRQSGRVNSTDSMAVVVALNIANELLASQQQHAQGSAQMEEQLLRMTQIIDQTLAKQPPLEVE